MSASNPGHQNLYELAAQVSVALRTRNRTLSTAESCTGGWIAKVVTDVPGSSGWFDRGFVSYSNAAKSDQLGVSAATIASYGAVSAEVVAEMAAGALERSRADVTLAVSGIAGPDGGSPDKPVGTVYLAWALREGPIRTERRHFAGSRDEVRLASVAAALQGVLDVFAVASTLDK
ncbi:MAG: nicotinamide-nucleotide amidase [Candidatus Competibacter sp.]|nr:nicotinamide-nucleotide amidase [Candidatus Competibacter sp.]